MSRGLTVDEIMSEIENSDVVEAKEKINLKLNMLSKFIRWSDSDYKEYDVLLDNLKKIKRKHNPSTSELGKSLEELVDFIFNKSYFYKVFQNKRSATNEIDQFVILSDNGVQALKDYNLERALLLTDQDYLLCECKNYKETVGATWVGKFNTLLDISGDCKLGIIFSCSGLTGQENNWYDSHGLTKIIYHLSPAYNKRYIIDFNLKDFELLKDKKNTILSIVKAKKITLTSNTKSEKLLEDLHEGANDIKDIYEGIMQ